MIQAKSKRMRRAIVVAEGNFNDEVRWGREITRSELENNHFKVHTVYPE